MGLDPGRVDFHITQRSNLDKEGTEFCSLIDKDAIGKTGVHCRPAQKESFPNSLRPLIAKETGGGEAGALVDDVQNWLHAYLHHVDENALVEAHVFRAEANAKSNWCRLYPLTRVTAL